MNALLCRIRRLNLLPSSRRSYLHCVRTISLLKSRSGIFSNWELWVQENKRLIDDPVRKVGQDLYDALMVGEVGKVFERVLEEGIEQSVPVALQLRFDRDDT